MGDVVELFDESLDGTVEKFVCIDCGSDSFRWYHSTEVSEVYVMECTDCHNPFMIVGQVVDESILETFH